VVNDITIRIADVLN